MVGTRAEGDCRGQSYCSPEWAISVVILWKRKGTRDMCTARTVRAQSRENIIGARYRTARGIDISPMLWRRENRAAGFSRRRHARTHTHTQIHFCSRCIVYDNVPDVLALSVSIFITGKFRKRERPTHRHPPLPSGSYSNINTMNCDLLSRSDQLYGFPLYRARSSLSQRNHTFYPSVSLYINNATIVIPDETFARTGEFFARIETENGVRWTLEGKSSVYFSCGSFCASSFESYVMRII